MKIKYSNNLTFSASYNLNTISTIQLFIFLCTKIEKNKYLAILYVRSQVSEKSGG